MTMSNRVKGIILLSGGLDSTVSLAIAQKSVDVKLALTFDYGQKPVSKEKEAAQKIAGFYNIEYKEIQLPWLKELTNSDSLWVPNRNALFINIAACYADQMSNLKYDRIIIGANKEEAADFPDNSKEFIDNINQSLKKSTLHDIEVFAPLVNMDKKQIVQAGIEEGAPLEFVYSCYEGGEKHCGVCKSCIANSPALLYKQ